MQDSRQHLAGLAYGPLIVGLGPVIMQPVEYAACDIASDRSEESHDADCDQE